MVPLASNYAGGTIDLYRLTTENYLTKLDNRLTALIPDLTIASPLLHGVYIAASRDIKCRSSTKSFSYAGIFSGAFSAARIATETASTTAETMNGTKKEPVIA